MNGYEQLEASRKVSPGRRYVPFLLTLCLGLGFALAMFAVVRGWQSRQIRVDFERAAHKPSSAVSSSIDETRLMPEPAGSLLGGSGWQPWSALAAGLMLTGLLAAHFLARVSRSTRSRRLADGQTNNPRQSEERYRSLVEIMSDWVWEMDRDGVYTYASPKIKDLLGYGLEEVIGKPVLRFLPPHEAERIAQLIQDLLKSPRAIVGLETTAHRKDGRLVVIETTAVPIFDASGNLAGYWGIDRDITAQKKADAEIRRLSSFPRLNPNPIIEISTEGEVTYCNAAALATLRQLGLEDPRVLLPADIKQSLEAADGVNEPQCCRELAVGERIFAELVFFCAEFNTLRIYLNDITERKQAEEKLRWSEHELTIRNQIADVFLTFAGEEMYAQVLQIIQRALDSQHGVLGYVDEDGAAVAAALSKGVWEQCHVSHKSLRFPRETWGDAIWGRAILEKKGLYCNKPARAPEGHVPIHRVLVVPIVYQEEAIGYVMVGNKPSDYDPRDQKLLESVANHMAPALHARLRRDTQERNRKQAEQELKEYAQALQAANQALEEAYDAARAATRAKSEFLANMSHEIRTPLTGILGYTELLMDADVPEAQRRSYLQTVRQNGEALLALINGILDLSKIEADRMTVEPTDCSPGQILQDAVSLLWVRAANKGISLEVEYATPLPQTIRTDPVRLRQILVNLVGNAVKFTEHGSVRITARCIYPQGRSPQIQFAVTDTGIGISHDKLNRLFKPFMQADMSTSRRFGGTGLGLAISNRLAILLGGDIITESKPGEGSTFTLSIDTGPLDGVPMLDTPPPALTEPDQPAAAARHRTLHGRVLLAEDGPDNQRLIRMILEKAGLEVDLAENGRIAYEMAFASSVDGKPYDLILMDIQMPDWDGYEATRRLRQDAWCGPIVALTAHAMVGDREKCLEVGCDGYAAKPIDRAGLLALAARHLGQATLADEPSQALPRVSTRP